MLEINVLSNFGSENVLWGESGKFYEGWSKIIVSVSIITTDRRNAQNLPKVIQMCQDVSTAGTLLSQTESLTRNVCCSLSFH